MAESTGGDEKRRRQGDPTSGLLTPETVPAYVLEHVEALGGLFTAETKLKAVEIQGGNLNYAFQVFDEEKGPSSPSIFVKQAPDFVKVFGPSMALHRERMELEVKAYREWAASLGEAAAQFLPKIMHFDIEKMTFIMEFLGGSRELDKELFEGRADTRPAAAMGEFMGIIHAGTHSSKVSKERAAALTTTYANLTLRGLQLEFVFTKAFAESDKAAYLREDAAFMAELEALKAKYKGETAGDLSLCHGDLHPGSVMFDSTKMSAKVIDPEFAVYGPPGLDVGSMLSGYVLAAIYHARTEGVTVAAALRTCVQEMWAKYSAVMEAAGVSAEVIAGIGEDAVGFAGAEVARTSMGFAGVRGIPIKDEAVKAVAVAQAVELARKCIMGRQGRGVPLLLEELDALLAAGAGS